MKLPGFPLKLLRRQKDIGYVLPSTIAASIIFLAIILDAIFENEPPMRNTNFIIGIGVGGSLYVIIQTLLIAPRIQKYRTIYIWANAVASGLGLSLLTIFLNEKYFLFFDILLILAVISISILSGRGPTYLLIAISECAHIIGHRRNLTSLIDWIIQFTPMVASIVITETVLRLREVTQNHIRRLEMMNTFSQQINSSLDTGQVLSILNAALQKAIEGDSYYVGLVDNDSIRLDLFYDDGEYFHDIKIPLTGTLSGWVITQTREIT